MDKINTTVEIDRALDEKFRQAVLDRKGFRKGVLGEGMTEALEWWVDPRIHAMVEKYLKEKK